MFAAGRARWYASALLVGIALAGVVAAYGAAGWQAGVPGSDTWVYLAAGERVLAGHSAYALLPGDRPVTIVPPYWTVPLLAPPTTLIAWAPLARLGDASMTIWALGNLLTTIASVAWILRGRSLAALGWIAILSPALGLLAFSGNVNGYILLALVAVWSLRDEPAWAGVLTAIAVALKLTPAFLLIWLAATRRWRALGAGLAAALVIALLTILVVGVDDVIEWVRTVPGSQPSPLALASLMNVPVVAVIVALTALVALVARRGDDRWAYSASIAAAALATPAFYFQAIALFAACVAPWSNGQAPAATSDPRIPWLRRNPA